MSKSVDPDETAGYEPSRLDLHCLQRDLIWSAELKGLNEFNIIKNHNTQQNYIKTGLVCLIL